MSRRTGWRGRAQTPGFPEALTLPRGIFIQMQPQLPPLGPLIDVSGKSQDTEPRSPCRRFACHFHPLLLLGLPALLTPEQAQEPSEPLDRALVYRRGEQGIRQVPLPECQAPHTGLITVFLH